MFNVTDIGLTAIRRITDLWSASKSDSLIDYTRVTSVQPMALMDTDAMFLEGVSDVMQSLLSQFAAYYLQAAALSNTVGKIEVRHQLDKLNPNRNPVDSGAQALGWLLAAENFKHRLPMAAEGIAMEKDPITALLRANDEQTRSEAVFEKDTNKHLQEAVNLSVGKQFSVEITDGQHKASIPINIRLMSRGVSSANLVHILSKGNRDNSAKERYHAWKSGEIEFIKDLIFCNDLIDRHRKDLMNDKDGLQADILNRARANQMATIVSGNPTVATSTNLVVMSDATATRLELDLNGKLDQFAVREKIFKHTYVMIMAVIDPAYNQVTFYYRGLKDKTQVSLRDLKASNKGGGPDVADLLKAYQLGNNPTL